MQKRYIHQLFLIFFLLFGSGQSLAGNDPLSDLLSGFNQSSSNQLLEPDEAFNLSATSTSQQTISLNWRIADGYYLYQNKIKVRLLQPTHLTLAAIDYPKGKQKHDEIFGDTIVYYQHLEIQQGLSTPLQQATELQLQVEFQGCADIGVCYPPMSKTMNVQLAATDSAAPTSTKQTLSEQDEIARSLSNNTLLLTCLTFLG
ncbi:MAG: protein-disulfide reductase DsbD N-terminal domain-containing protein, partial [Cycloclasticus sp.]